MTTAKRNWLTPAADAALGSAIAKFMCARAVDNVADRLRAVGCGADDIDDIAEALRADARALMEQVAAEVEEWTPTNAPA